MQLVGIELGGTSCKVGIADASTLSITHTQSFETSKEDPQITLEQMSHYIQPFASQIQKIGIACFGPVDLDKNSKTYGYITSTPKKAWQQCNVVGHFQKSFPTIPIAFDTDVNAPAVAEYDMCKGKVKSVAYVTVGTGIGVGIVSEHLPVHGMLHPEAGHLYAPIHSEDVQFKGVCPFHSNCIEGMASNVSLASRLNISIQELAQLEDDNKVWDIAAHYLAHLCVNLILIVSVQKIVMGGGVMNRKLLFSKIRNKVKELLNHYLQHELLENKMDEFIVPSVHGERSGLYGAIYLAKQ